MPATTPAETTTAATPLPQTAPSPQSYGVGARFSLHPMTEVFADLILSALAETDTRGLDIHTDDVSTCLRGPEADLLAYLVDVIARVAGTGVHTAAHVLLSRGCPGEITCELGDAPAHAPEQLTHPAPTGLRAAAHWSLYPLSDGPGPDHMAGIYAAIENAKTRGTFAGSEHYATRLEGDLADVLATAVDGWLLVGRHVQHVTSHLSLSLNSPTAMTAPLATAGAR